MTELTASEARIPPKIFSAVAYAGKRVCIRRHGEEEIYIISKEDMEILKLLEDKYWAETALDSIREMEKSGEKPTPWKKVKKDLGL